MGAEIKKNELGQYSMKSSISDESYHPEQELISEDEAKKILITNAIYDLIEKVVKIELEFPYQYSINGVRCMDKKITLYDFMDSIDYNDTKLITKFEETLKKYDIDLGFDK